MLKKTFAVLSLLSFLLPALSVSAQRRATIAAKKPPAAAAKCSGAWTGSIVYTRTQGQSDNKTVPRISGRGQDTRDWRMDYNYTAQVSVLESPAKNGTSIGRATISHTMSSIEKIDGVESNSCDRGKTFQDMHGSSTSRTDITGNATVEANVNIGVNEDGTYSVSVGVPQIKGKVSGSTTSSFSGQCTPKEGKSSSLPATETSLDGHSLTSDGTTRINEGDPNHISGSYSLKTPGGVVETIAWNLRRCGGALQITDLKFADMKFPNWDDWQDITEQVGTIDGNWVKVKAKVLNTSGETKSAAVAFKETYKGDKWDGAKPDMPIKDQMVDVTLEAGEEKEVEILWDTSGYAWYDDGRPRLVQRVKAELWEKNKLLDDITKNLKVAPKPVVLVHGLWANWMTFETWQNILTTSHSYDWKAFPVGEKSAKGLMDTGQSFMSTRQTASIGDNAHQLESYIKYAQEDRNAWHVDIVAHSIGGLISRYYIAQIMPSNTPDGRPKVEHLVMLGTPNLGTPCAEVMDLAFGLVGKSVEAIRQLQPEYVDGFNRVNSNRKGVKFSSLAGNVLPTMCKSIVWNDGFVPVPSAKWNISDTAESRNINTDLTGTADFSNFVKPHLAIGPKGNHNPDAPQLPGGIASTGWITTFDPATFVASTRFAAGMFTQPFAKSVKLAPHQSTEVEIPVEIASNFGMTFMSDPKVSVTLMNDKGGIVGKNLADSPEARAWFRSIYVPTPVTAGKWKAKIENTGDLEYEIVLTTWANAR